jgi:hypothetical protein
MSEFVPPLRRHNVMARMRTTLFLPFTLFHGDACTKSQYCGGVVLTGEIAFSWRETNRNATFFYPKHHMQGHSLEVRLVRPPRAAESKGRQNEPQNVF